MGQHHKSFQIEAKLSHPFFPIKLKEDTDRASHFFPQNLFRIEEEKLFSSRKTGAFLSLARRNLNWWPLAFSASKFSLTARYAKMWNQTHSVSLSSISLSFFFSLILSSTISLIISLSLSLARYLLSGLVFLLSQSISFSLNCCLPLYLSTLSWLSLSLSLSLAQTFSHSLYQLC